MRLYLCSALSVAALAACAAAVPRKAQPHANARKLAPEGHPNGALPGRITQQQEAAGAQAPDDQPVSMRSPAKPECPEGMLLLRRPVGRYCIDRYEASLVERRPPARPWPGNQNIDGREAEFLAVSRAGVKPQGYISGAQAEVVCHNAGKRLCELDEWVRACRGPKVTRYPYGDQRKPNICNDRFKRLDRHPVVRLFQETARAGTDPRLMWYPSFMNQPRLHEMPDSVSETGAFPGCTNEFGAYDMVGNLHEWVAGASGIFVGGFFMDTFQNGEGCEYRTLAHPFDYHDYSTGFRCCSEPAEAGRGLASTSAAD